MNATVGRIVHVTGFGDQPAPGLVLAAAGDTITVKVSTITGDRILSGLALFDSADAVAELADKDRPAHAAYWPINPAATSTAKVTAAVTRAEAAAETAVKAAAAAEAAVKAAAAKG